jgi:aspartyl protease
MAAGLRSMEGRVGRRHLFAAAAAFLITPLEVSAQQTERTPTNATAHSSSAKRPLPIFYDAALVAKGFPSPLVKARIAGHEALFIIDSGASVNVLADWYARLAEVPTTTAAGTATGSGGKTAAVQTAHRLRGHWSNGQGFTLKEAIVVAFPPLFETLHLGGLVSPQLLAPVGTAAVLDLKMPSLKFVPFARALSDLHLPQAITVPQQVCRNPDSQFVNRVYLAPVSTAAVTDRVLIDTGATKTIFSAESKIAHAIETASELGPRSEGVGGEVSGQRMVRNVQLIRGGQTVVLNPSIGEVAAPCDAKGLLGMDALRSCLLILGDSEMVFSCD